MNFKMIFHTIGQVLIVLSAMLLFPLIVSLIYVEWMSVIAFSVTAVSSFAVGMLLSARSATKRSAIYAREGLIIVSLAWIVVSLVGSVPFVISGDIPSFTDAFFETVSGFTTTGATILTDVEHLTHGMLFWRSFTHWIGGMGVLVFAVAIVSRTPDRSMHILKAEMPGPIVDKLVPRAKDTAKILYIIYIGLTVLLMILLLCGGMPFFDSVVHAFGTAGTGGFGIKNNSIAGYNHYLQWVIAIFMMLFGVNFNVYYLILIKKFKTAFGSRELWIYIATILACTALICVNMYSSFSNIADLIRASFFSVSSVMTTTGFTIADFTQWGHLSKTILIILMFVGGCAGSTAGGLKLTRVIILIKKMGNELKRIIHPRAATIVKFEGKRVDDDTLHGVSTYLAIYIVSFAIILFIISFEQSFSFEANFTAVASCFNNIGPIFDNAAGGGTFVNYSVFSKLLLSFSMLLGRLEIYPLLLTIVPYTWMKNK